MNIEELTKAQLILLALLVSFVTSIATGIVTVSLLDQAPPAVTRTINRVVERTVERVVPPAANQNASVKEVTVVVKEEDLITESIEKNAKSLVRLHAIPTGEEARVFLGLGMFVKEDGLIATDASLVVNDVSYQAVISDGSILNARVIRQSGDMALLEIERDEEDKTVFSPVSFAGDNSLKLGQTVISLGGAERNQVAVGVIAAIVDGVPPAANATSSPESTTALVDTTILSKAVAVGSPLINMFGEVIGISTVTSRKNSTGVFTSTETLPSLIEETLISEEETEEL